MKVQLKDITADVYPNHILCSFLCTDGSYIKEKYIGYKQGEAKKLFLSKYKEILN